MQNLGDKQSVVWAIGKLRNVRGFCNMAGSVGGGGGAGGGRELSRPLDPDPTD